MRLILPYMARWHSVNRSRYHQLLSELGRQGHEIHVFQAPPLNLGDISFTEMAAPPEPNIHLHEISVPAILWHRRLPSEKVLKKGILSLITRGQLRAFAETTSDGVLMLYNLPQIGLMNLPGYRVHFDMADNLIAMLRYEVGRGIDCGAAWAATWVQNHLVQNAEGTTVASSLLLSQAGQRATVLPNGANLVELAAADGRVERAKFKGPTIGFLGAFEYWIDTPLLRAVAQRLPNVHFLLAGGGRRWHQIQAELGSLPNVHMPGPVLNRYGLDMVAAMDICWIPFTRDPVSNASCPIKLFEYAGLCKPTISTRLTEVMRFGQGWVRFADTVDETVDVIEDLLAHPAQARALGEDARHQVEQHYNWTRLAEQFYQLLDSPSSSGNRCANRPATNHRP